MSLVTSSSVVSYWSTDRFAIYIVEQTQIGVVVMYIVLLG